MLHVAGIVIALMPSMRWRAQVLRLYATGQISDIDLGELIEFMLPGSDQSLAFLVDNRNPYATIKNARTSADDVEMGGRLFRDACASCHGPDGSGGPVAPALVGRTYKHGDSDWAVYRTIHLGVPGTAMQIALPLTKTERWQVISYLRFIDVPDRTQTSVQRVAPRAVSSNELSEVRAPGADWLTYSGDLRSTRHSGLAQIDRDDVHSLSVRWVHQFAGQPMLEVSPLVRDGVMFVTVPPCSVHALDAHVGKTLWTWSCTLTNDSASEIGGTINRGVALLDDKVFVATWDADFVALSAATGRELWQKTVDPDAKTYYISAAPLAFGDVVVTGVATRQEWSTFIVAYDAKTGAERWRFMAIPGPGEPGNDTWSGDSWKTGGAPTWLTGSYDAENDLLFWGVGNPKPDYNDTAGRAGDNLYTNSVVALRGNTGQLVWHFQFTPADDKDSDANQIPVIADHRSADGTVDKLLLWANRNGFYYVIDRISGRFLTGVPFVQQNWASGLDANGRPIEIKRADHGAQGELLYPGNVGGTSWWSPTYDPACNS